MSLDVSRAAVIGGAVVEATLAKQSQHFSFFFFEVPYRARITLFFINCIFLYIFPDRRQVHPLLVWLAPLCR